MIKDIMDDIKDMVITEDFERIMNAAVRDICAQFFKTVAGETERTFKREEILLDRNNIFLNLSLASAFQIIEATAKSVNSVPGTIPGTEAINEQTAKESIMAHIDILIRDLDLTATLLRCK
jgi:hypothetical protein